MSVTISAGYAWVLFFAVLVALFNVFLMVLVGRARSKTFTKKFFATNFPQLAERHAIALHGYPDTGSGYYSQKLSYEDWLHFNNVQRVHNNYLEGVTMALVFILVAGLVFPRATVILEIAYLVGRFFYSVEYVAKGPNGRLGGVIVLDLALLGLAALALVSALQLGGGVSGLVELLSTGK